MPLGLQLKAVVSCHTDVLTLAMVYAGGRMVNYFHSSISHTRRHGDQQNAELNFSELM